MISIAANWLSIAALAKCCKTGGRHWRQTQTAHSRHSPARPPALTRRPPPQVRPIGEGCKDRVPVPVQATVRVLPQATVTAPEEQAPAEARVPVALVRAVPRAVAMAQVEAAEARPVSAHSTL